MLFEGVWRIFFKANVDREMRDLRVMLKTVYDSMPSAIIFFPTVPMRSILELVVKEYLKSVLEYLKRPSGWLLKPKITDSAWMQRQ